jgi:hypothetical protein
MRSQSAAKCSCGNSKSVTAAHEILLNTLFLVPATTRALHFRSQENFFAEIEN